MVFPGHKQEAARKSGALEHDLAPIWDPSACKVRIWILSQHAGSLCVPFFTFRMKGLKVEGEKSRTRNDPLKKHYDTLFTFLNFIFILSKRQRGSARHL